MCDDPRPPPRPPAWGPGRGAGGKNLGGNDSSVIRILSAEYLFDTHLAKEMIKLALQMKAWWRKRWRKFSPRKKAVANIIEGNDSRKQKRWCLRWREVQQGGIFMLNRNLLENRFVSTIDTICEIGSSLMTTCI